MSLPPVECLPIDAWCSIAERLAMHDRIRLSMVCTQLRHLDVQGRGDLTTVERKARMLRQLHMCTRLWKKRLALHPPNNPSLVSTVVDFESLSPFAHPPLYVAFMRNCPGVLQPHASMGRSDWPIREKWYRVPAGVTDARCRRCGVRIDFTAMDPTVTVPATATEVAVQGVEI